MVSLAALARAEVCARLRFDPSHAKRAPGRAFGADRLRQNEKGLLFSGSESEYSNSYSLWTGSTTGHVLARAWWPCVAV